MFTRAIFLVSFLFYSVITSTDATVSCTNCQGVISINLTTDATIDTQACTLKDSNICLLELSIDYIDPNMTFALFSDSSSPMLVLTNGEPQIAESTSIWFTEVRVQRMAIINCFSGSSCGLDQIKKIYKDEYRSFNYTLIQSSLADLLYTTESNSALTCADANGASIPCQDGFCRSITDGNGFVTLSSCMKFKDITPAYGLIAQKVKTSDLDTPAATLTYTCNKPMCNSKETAKEVISQLATAGIIPEPGTITTTTTQPSQAVELLNNRNLIFISFFVFLFSILNI